MRVSENYWFWIKSLLMRGDLTYRLLGKEEEEQVDEKCSMCGQTEFHSGEYPCRECGRPTLWDVKEVEKE